MVGVRSTISGYLPPPPGTSAPHFTGDTRKLLTLRAPCDVARSHGPLTADGG